MTFSGRRLGVALPDTVLEEHDSLREKTVKLGTIARSCAIYGVDTIVIFRDPKGRGESRLITRVLEYLETPQYLRRSLFGFDEALKYAGLLPPLRIPSHKQRVQVEKLKVGEIREGVTLSDGRVNIGLEKHPYLGQHLGANKRVTVRIKETTPLTGELVAREAAHEYWGYSVELRTLDELVALRGRLAEWDPYACRAHAERHFSHLVMTQEYLRMYRGLLETGRLPSGQPAPLSRATRHTSM